MWRDSAKEGMIHLLVKYNRLTFPKERILCSKYIMKRLF